MYSPCLECYRQYRRTYTSACDKICDYANCIKTCHEWKIVCDYALHAMDVSNQTLERLFGKEEVSDGK